MVTRLMLLISLILLLAGPALAQCEGFQALCLETACQGDELVLRVNVRATYEGETLSVRRLQSAPDMLGELDLAEAIPIPFDGSYHEYLISDPGIGPEDVGIYQAVTVLDGSHFRSVREHLSCTPDPYLMRGILNTSADFTPCVDVGLLECETVELLYGELSIYVGIGELLEVYGWPQDLDARDDCSVLVTRIESLGPNTYCEDVVATGTTSWGAIKARFR